MLEFSSEGWPIVHRGTHFDSAFFYLTEFNDKSCSVYGSVPFKFIVDGNPFYIHAELTSLHSKPLDRMMNNGMAEPCGGVAELKEVDQGTFARFIEWAYKGYYSAPSFSLQAVSPSPAKWSNSLFSSGNDHMKANSTEDDMAPPCPVEDPNLADWGWASNFRGKKKKSAGNSVWPTEAFSTADHQSKSSKRAFKQSFLERKNTVRRNAIDIPPPRANQKAEEDYTEILLCHARMYVFAEQFDIQLLKSLAFEELQATLAIFTLYVARTGDIIALLRYVYSETGPSTDGVEDLRTLLIHYVDYEIDTLMKDEEFNEVMVENGGPLLGDVVSMLAKRIP